MKNKYQYDEDYEETIEEYEEELPVTIDDWMHYNGLSWSDFI